MRSSRVASAIRGCTAAWSFTLCGVTDEERERVERELQALREQNASLARTLADGETERIVREALATKARAISQGRPDIAEGAQQVIDRLVDQHVKSTLTHMESVDVERQHSGDE
jgi:regulator of protease activity HflC (stomatin/prohibitin superfamily)